MREILKSLFLDDCALLENEKANEEEFAEIQETQWHYSK